MINQELKIKQEFRDLIPPLTSHEYAGLEEDIKFFGCKHPIETWNGYIIDGHHRYEICRKHKLSFKTEERSFDTQLDVEIWMISNQFSRRNIVDFVRGELALKLKKRLKEKAEENSRTSKSLEKFHKESVKNESQTFETRTPKTKKEKNEDCVDSKVGEAAGISRMQIYKIEKIKETADDKELEELRSGKKTINKSYMEKKREAKQEVLQTTEFPKGKYRVIYADPPWQYGDQRALDRGGAEEQYPTMSLDSICELPISQISDENSVLFLWATTPLLQEGLDVMKAWGFDYKTLFTWDKERSFFGHYNGVAQEFLLLGTKGSCVPDCQERLHSIVRSKRTKHSEKPEEFRQIIETLYKYGNKVELFARKKVDGWEVYGNECG